MTANERYSPSARNGQHPSITTTPASWLVVAVSHVWRPPPSTRTCDSTEHSSVDLQLASSTSASGVRLGPREGNRTCARQSELNMLTSSIGASVVRAASPRGERTNVNAADVSV